METIGAILLAVILTVTGIGLGALLIYGLITLMVHISEKR